MQAKVDLGKAEELEARYDPEMSFRPLGAGVRWLVYAVLVGLGIYHYYTAGFGIPLTHRGLNHGVRFITGHMQNDEALELDWDRLADPDCTLVIYMGARRVAALCQDLQDHGKAATTPAAVVEQGTTRDQRVTGGTLATLPGRLGDVRTPGLLIVGDVARLAGELQWFEAAPKIDQSTQTNWQ